MVISRYASACALAITSLVRPPWFGMPRRCIYTLYRAAKKEEKGKKEEKREDGREVSLASTQFPPEITPIFILR